MQNYEVQHGHQLIIGGRLHGEGEVLPAWYADRDGGLAARLSVGCLAPTAKVASAGLPAPTPKVAEDPTAGLYAEADRLSRENAEFAMSNRELSLRVEALQKENANLTAALGKATADNAHLAAACEDHQSARDALEARVAGLEKELEQATAPATPKAEEPAADPAAEPEPKTKAKPKAAAKS